MLLNPHFIPLALPKNVLSKLHSNRVGSKVHGIRVGGIGRRRRIIQRSRYEYIVHTINCIDYILIQTQYIYNSQTITNQHFTINCKALVCYPSTPPTLNPFPPKIWISEVFIEKNEVVICPFLERIKSKVIYVPSNSKNGVSNMESMLVRFKELKFHQNALLVKLVNTVDLKSILARVVGSSPTEGIRRSGRVVNGGRL